MNRKIAVRAVLAWGAVLVLAVVNGLLREAVWVPRLGATAGLVVSGVLLCALIVAAAWWLLPWLGARSRASQLGIGLEWLALTVAFELAFGLLQGRTLSALLAAYRFEGGNLWPLVLLVTAASPWLAARLRGWH